MSETKPADIILALQKVTEGFTAIIDRPTDTDIINICQLLFLVLMQKKYNELTLTDNLYGVILLTDRNKYIYGKVLYEILPSVASYDTSIETNASKK